MPTYTDFRKLCEDLLDELQYQTDWSIAEDLKKRAYAALAEPEPEAPTPSDEELIDLAVSVFEYEFATDKDYARAVLARWGK